MKIDIHISATGRMRLLPVLAMAMALACCGKQGSAHSAQARSEAVQEAKQLLQADTTDTFALQRSLLHAESVRSKYVIMGDTVAARDFDQALREVVVRKSPKLARKLF